MNSEIEMKEKIELQVNEDTSQTWSNEEMAYQKIRIKQCQHSTIGY